MLVDRKHIPWAVATSVAGLVSLGAYVWDAPRHLEGPGGSTVAGLTFGIAGYALMLFCVALGLKRRVPHWRLGRAQTWLRGHIWLGLLACLLVALHSAFKAGGPLTTWLWVLVAVVTVSGILGLVLQQFLPSLLLHSVPGETVAQQLSRALEDLNALGEQAVVEFAGAVDRPAPAYHEAAGTPGQPPAGGEPLRRFYLDHVRGFLRGSKGSILESSTQSQRLFESLRTMTPPHIHAGVDRLERLCERRRQLLEQTFIMRILMVWLILHVPLSWVLVTLTAIHAVVALRYG